MIQNKYKSIRQIIFLGLIICIFSLFIVSCQTKEQPINSTDKTITFEYETHSSISEKLIISPA